VYAEVCLDCVPHASLTGTRRASHIPFMHLALRTSRVAPLLCALSLVGGCHSTRATADIAPLAPSDTVHVVTFGDSNTDFGWAGTDPRPRARSYISDGPSLRPAPGDTSSQFTVAGKIERLWRAESAIPIRAVNHGISGTTTGGGGHGGRDRNPAGAPNMRAVVDGVTRFDGEVLGAHYPWSGGEPTNAAFPNGAILRANAFVPGAHDFAYVSIGTNDLPNDSIPPARTIENLTWMVQRWISTGHAPDRLVITTLAPDFRSEAANEIPTLNKAIRALAARTGVGLIDLASYTSDDDGRTWKSAAMHIGDRLHYSEAVREWIAAQMVEYVQARVSAPAFRRAPSR
jgi:lysophospholipase L1-like esterase